jgi:PPM family protein phosphatase
VIQAFGVTDTGPVRKMNEDCFVVDDELRLFVVADGMGGHNAGEVASRLAIEAIVGFVRRSYDDCEFSWPYGIDTSMSYDANRLRTAIHLANRRVFRTAESHDDYTGMGTTVVSALCADSRVSIGHVGDSRVYLYSGGVLRQITQDDSWIATTLARDAAADPAMLAHHPMRNVLTNVLGARDETDIHLAEHPLSPGDVLLLCTDGLHGAVPDQVMADVLATHASNTKGAEELARALVSEALQRGTRDNVTALVVAYGGAA